MNSRNRGTSRVLSDLSDNFYRDSLSTWNDAKINEISFYYNSLMCHVADRIACGVWTLICRIVKTFRIELPLWNCMCVRPSACTCMGCHIAMDHYRIHVSLQQNTTIVYNCVELETQNKKKINRKAPADAWLWWLMTTKHKVKFALCTLPFILKGTLCIILSYTKTSHKRNPL